MCFILHSTSFFLTFASVRSQFGVHGNLKSDNNVIFFVMFYDKVGIRCVFSGRHDRRENGIIQETTILQIQIPLSNKKQYRSWRSSNYHNESSHRVRTRMKGVGAILHFSRHEVHQSGCHFALQKSTNIDGDIFQTKEYTATVMLWGVTIDGHFHLHAN